MKIKKVNMYEILFDNNSTLESYHEQNCCESHYVDFSSLDGQGWEGQEFPETLKELLCNKFTNINYNKIPVPLEDPFDYSEKYTFVNIKDVEGNIYTMNIYNSNNGYYSTNVSLKYTTKDPKVVEMVVIQD